jgi:hypothetical protein
VLASRKPEWVLLLFKTQQTTSEVVEVVAKYIVVTTYDEPVSYCFGRNVRGGEGTLLGRFNVGEVLFFPLSLLTFLVLLVSSLLS